MGEELGALPGLLGMALPPPRSPLGYVEVGGFSFPCIFPHPLVLAPGAKFGSLRAKSRCCRVLTRSYICPWRAVGP